MKKKIEASAIQWSNPKILISALWGLLFLVLSLFINYLAGTYATNHMSNTVTDLILDHLPVFDVQTIFIDGIVWFFIFVGVLAALRPKRIPFVLKSFSLFIVIRSFFIILTHLAPISQQISLDVNSSIVNTFTFTGDLFFSGHTGLPFLMALVFWDEPWLRWIFMGMSVFFGVVVLLGHLHYSIDVFSAYFITFGIFQISTRLFAKDYFLLNSRIPQRRPKP
jgi:PAP2 superfamily C-terminal